MTCNQREFVDRVHHHFNAGKGLVDGYAPFCKHVFIPNEWDCTVDALRITDDNRGQLRSAYTRRRAEELPVLTRWFPAEAVTATKAAWLDVIMYSRDQITKEYEALPLEGRAVSDLPRGAPWGIISIKAQDVATELPMTPMTMMRNALGKNEGGSGVPLDKEKYEAACAYWDEFASIQ